MIKQHVFRKLMLPYVRWFWESAGLRLVLPSLYPAEV